MSQAANPTCPITQFTPGPGDPHSQAHPMVQLPSSQSQPFTLLKGPNNTYNLTFENQIDGNANNHHPDARVYIAAFVTEVSTPTWTHSVKVPAGTPNNSVEVDIPAADIGSSTHIWMGAWWNDGTYPDTLQGIKDYFAAHPSGGNHHTVPIIPG